MGNRFSKYLVHVPDVPRLAKVPKLEAVAFRANRLWAAMGASTEGLQAYYSYRKRLPLFTENTAPSFDITGVPLDAMFLGFYDAAYTLGSVFQPQINIISEEGGRRLNKSKVIGIFGRKGSGKSIELGIIGLDNIIYRYKKTGIKIPCLVIDPNRTAEWHTRTRKITDMFPERAVEIENFLSSYGMEPTQYSCRIWTPAFNRDEPLVTDRYRLTLRDFIRIADYDLGLAQQLLGDLIGIDDVRARRGLSTVLLNAKPESITNFRRLIAFYERYGVKEPKLLPPFKFIKSTKIPLYLEDALSKDIISDSDESELDRLAAHFNEYDYVIFRTKNRSLKVDPLSDAWWGVYTIVFMERYIQELTALKSDIASQRARATIKAPYGGLIIGDEIESVAPRKDTYTTLYFENVATKLRKADITFLFATQEASKVNEALMGQIDLFIVSKIESDANAKVLTDRDINPKLITILRHLKKRTVNPFGFEIPEWALVDENNTIHRFYSILSLAAFKA